MTFFAYFRYFFVQDGVYKQVHCTCWHDFSKACANFAFAVSPTLGIKIQLYGNRRAMESIPYRLGLGPPLYLSTRAHPGFLTAVSILGQFQETPLLLHRKVLQSVVCYVSGTRNYGLMVPFGENVPVEVWSDVYLERDNHKRRSPLGYIVTNGGIPVVWASRIQLLTALIATKVEFLSLAQCVKEHYHRCR